jgi:hypothetical protein
MAVSNSKSRRDFLKGAAVFGGAASLGACTSAQNAGSASLVTQQNTSSLYPRHNERTRGWMRFIWDKATTPDDWGYSEDIERPWGIALERGEINWTDDGKGPHPWWDQYTSAPMLSYPRFDLSDSSYVVMMMANQTPAWREVYTRIMDELATRHTSYWAAIDWNTFIGPSPNRGNYTALNAPGYQAWPERVRGNYDRPGWTANGVEPWGLQPDPIGADGNLFFRGWLNLLLSIYKYVSGDDKWEQPWEIAGYENEHFEWTQPGIVEHLAQQYADRPEGPNCENTKIWPFCNSAAGLGIYLSDQLGVTNAHGVFENWIEFMKDNYMGINDQNQIEWMTLYYDPLADFKVNIPGTAGAGAGTAFYLLPQSPQLATQIYEALATSSGWHDPNREIQPNALGQVMARALGDYTAVERLQAAAERYSEPRFFGADNDRFGWWFNNGEPWPRGQGCAQQMINEVAGGNWIDAFKIQDPDRYTAPTLEGIDYPSLGVDTAWNDKENGILHVGTYVADRSRNGQSTEWRITNLPNASDAVVIRNGTRMTNVQVVDQNTIRVPTEIGDHRYEIFTGYYGQEVAMHKPDPVEIASVSGLAARRRTAEENFRAAESVMVSGAANCPCCKGAA